MYTSGQKRGDVPMADETSTLVLRSVYLPADMDEQLRTLAFRKRRSKSDVIREFIQLGLQQSAASEKPNANMIGGAQTMRRNGAGKSRFPPLPVDVNVDDLERLGPSTPRKQRP
jgi:Arc/MetJ-type ribon-helix-helix transcriptional regulator